MMRTKIAVMLDGGHLRAQAKHAGKLFHPDYIEKIAMACCNASETIQRILYCDCPPFSGTATLPVSGTPKKFNSNGQWLHQLSHKELFAVRRGVLKFRGFVLNKIPYIPSGPLKDSDFHADFEQKGVDMRIGLDMAIYSANRSVELIALATNDAPA